jgi:hypothetical protein
LFQNSGAVQLQGTPADWGGNKDGDAIAMARLLHEQPGKSYAFSRYKCDSSCFSNVAIGKIIAF